MTNTILVPTDFSDCARHAEQVAVEIALRKKAGITFIHGMSVGSRWDLLPEERQQQYPEVSAALEQVEKMLAERIAGAARRKIEAKKSIVFIEGQKSMGNNLLTNGCDMIVMGAVGDNDLSKFVIGANTARVLRASTTPVLIVKQAPPQPLVFKTIVYASGLEPDTHEVFERFLGFAKTMGVESLHMVEVTTPHNFKPSSAVRERMETFVARHEFKNIWLHNYNHYTIEAGIIEFATRVEADLLAIANHGRTDLTSLFIQSVPENLVKFSHFPVLSIRV
jgi:nucleotide-binding universal stress UspA family protein